jgi:hypothetical protein
VSKSPSQLNLGPKKVLREHWDRGYQEDWQKYAEELLGRWIRKDKVWRSEVRCALIGLRAIAEDPHKTKREKEITNLYLELQAVLKQLR